MAQPIKGYEGTISVEGTPTGFVNSWEVTLETESADVGPFIGDGGRVYTYTTSRQLTGTLEATVPVGKDAGQTTLISGAVNGSYVDLELVTTNGYTVTVVSGSISGFSMAQDAGESVTVTFDFTAGDFTIV